MRADNSELFAVSGVPLVFDRFGMIGPWIAEVVDPLSAARGIAAGLAMGIVLWFALAALIV